MAGLINSVQFEQCVTVNPAGRPSRPPHRDFTLSVLEISAEKKASKDRHAIGHFNPAKQQTER